MPTTKTSPAAWIKIRWLHIKMFFIMSALRLLFRAMGLLLGRAPNQEELDLIFDGQKASDELLKHLK
jgi:hypothetical protein